MAILNRILIVEEQKPIFVQPADFRFVLESAVGTRVNEAETARDEARSARDAAQTAEQDADEHKTTAQRYASESEDTTVVDADTGNDTGTYSAVHHRNKAEAAESAAQDWAAKAENAVVGSVFGRTGDVVAQAGDYTKSQVGLGNVANRGPTGTDNQHVTGTAGVSGNFTKWSVDGDAVDSGVAVSAALLDSDLAPTGNIPQTDRDNTFTGTQTFNNISMGQMFSADAGDTSDAYIVMDETQIVLGFGDQSIEINANGVVITAKSIDLVETA